MSSQVFDLSIVAPINFRASADAGRRFECQAYSGGILRVGGFPLPVVVDLEKVEIPQSQAIPLVIGHSTDDPDRAIGQADTVVNDGSRLLIAGFVSGQSDDCRRVLAMHDAGHQWQASIGGLVRDYKEIPADHSVRVNGRDFVGPIIVATDFQWRETSVVNVGGDSDPRSVVNLAASAALTGVEEMGEVPSFEDWVKETYEQDAANLGEKLKVKLMQEYAAAIAATSTEGAEGEAAMAAAGEVGASPDDKKEPAMAASALLNLRASASADLKRIGAINAKYGKSHPLIAAAAIDKGLSLEQTELQVLREGQRQRAPAGHVRNGEKPSPKMLEAALCVSGKLRGVEKMFDDQTLQAAHDQYHGRAPISEILLHAAMENGYSRSRHGRIVSGELEDVLYHAMPPRGTPLRASAGGSLTGILSNVANKFILEGYNTTKGIEDARKIHGPGRAVPDFKEVTSYRLIDGGEYQELGPNGKIQMGTLSEDSYANRAKTYAKMYKLTRPDIINDDLGALDRVREMLGQGSARKFLSVFWTEFLADHSTFFTEARANYDEGGDTAFSLTSLPLAEALFLNQRTPQGTPLDVQVKYLLVPTALGSTAREIYVSQNLVGISTNKQGAANIYAGMFEPIVTPYLQNATYTGYSSKAWYLLPEPTQNFRVIEACFLDGQESPTVETAEAVFDELGIMFRGYFDFGVRKQEYRAAVKMKGEA